MVLGFMEPLKARNSLSMPDFCLETPAWPCPSKLLVEGGLALGMT